MNWKQRLRETLLGIAIGSLPGPAFLICAGLYSGWFGWADRPTKTERETFSILWLSVVYVAIVGGGLAILGTIRLLKRLRG